MRYLTLRGDVKEQATYQPVDEFGLLLRQNMALPLNSADFSDCMRRFGLRVNRIDDIDRMSDKRSIALGGSVDDFRVIMTKKGTPREMVFISLVDKGRKVDVTVFPDQYAMIKPYLKKNVVLYVSGVVNVYQGKKGVIANDVRFLTESLPGVEPDTAEEIGSTEFPILRTT
jgi:DNA polymerase III alpha subunit